MDSAGQERVWFITGASTGLGRHLADTALYWGDRVVVTARDDASLGDFEEEHRGRTLAARLDVREPQQARDAVRAATEGFGRIDVLVNNAGYGVFGPLEEIPDADLRREFETNVFGAVNVVRAVLPVMRGQRAGHIVQISSLEGVAPALAGETAYSGTKFAVEGIHEALAREVAHLGIGVTIVEPGPIRTEFADGAVVTEPRDPDYAESVGKALEWFADLAGNQPNDPARVATAIIAAVDSPEPPLRLALGGEAIEAIREKLDGQLADLDAWETLGASTAAAA
ncbi:MAG TPA: oxidoreductase [Solirubrobacterales bacterium]|nr:oxidoreductase [Solirubrobacterales bacterium]